MTAAEGALVAAWNMEGDSAALLSLAHERIATFSDQVTATLDEMAAEEATAIEDTSAVEEEAEVVLPAQESEQG